MSTASFAHIEGVHPQTGLATDYLNHYNEIVMLIELIPSMPDCVADARHWAPKSYVEHFRDSGLSIAGEVIDAYTQVPPDSRHAFEQTTAELDGFLSQAVAQIVSTAERGDNQHLSLMTEETLIAARSMLGRLNGIIHGFDARGRATQPIGEAQAAVDAMF